MRKPLAVFTPNVAQPRSDLANVPRLLMRFSAPSIAHPRSILAVRAAFPRGETTSTANGGAIRSLEIVQQDTRDEGQKVAIFRTFHPKDDVL